MQMQCDVHDTVSGCTPIDVASTGFFDWVLYLGIGFFDWVLYLGIRGVILALVIAALRGSVRIAMEYERGVLFRLGRFRAVKGPGLYFKIPLIDRAETVSLQIETNEITQQEMITKDSISLMLSAVVFFRVKDPQAALIEVEDFRDAIDQFSLTTLRNVIGSSTLDEVLSDRDKVTATARQMLDEVTEKWGVEAQRVEIKQIELPDSMKRAMAREAEAIREKRARIIKAEGEAQAAEQLTTAAQTIAASPGAMELRRLQTLSEVGAEHNSTIIIGIPQELLVAAKALGGMAESPAFQR
jgi:regulator of protease activity HflC (stomatin/prohibitin superfamily)